MTAFLLVHGAWHGAWCWDLLRPHLEEAGARALAIDLPTDDPAACYTDLVDVVVDAIRGAQDDVVVVAHSFGGLLGPVAAAETQDMVERIVLLCALLPVPGRSLRDQLSEDPDIFTPQMADDRTERLDGTGWPKDRAIELFYHDCPPDVARWAAGNGRPHADTVRGQPCPLDAWPEIVTESIVCLGDRVVDPAWSRRAARDRLGIPVRELQGGHSPFLSRPAELASVLLGNRVEAEESVAARDGMDR